MVPFVTFVQSGMGPVAVRPEAVVKITPSARGSKRFFIFFDTSGRESDDSVIEVDHDGDLDSLCRRLEGFPIAPPPEIKATVKIESEPRPAPKTWDAFRLDVAESLRKGLKAEGVEGALAPIGSHRLSSEIGNIADINKAEYEVLKFLRQVWPLPVPLSRGRWDDFIVSELHYMITDILKHVGISGPAERLIAEASVSWFLRRHWKRPY